MARVRLFAALREIAGSRTLNVEEGDVQGIVAALGERFGPRFRSLVESGSVVVNGEVALPAQRVGPSDEVALLPPFSGG